MPAPPRFRGRKADSKTKSETSRYSDEKIPVGDIRMTQLITTFGVGAIVDFKKDTVVIASTDDWDYPSGEEVEERKIYNENLSVLTGAEYFLLPRTTQSTNNFTQGKDVAAYIFPEKLHCSKCGLLYDYRELDTKQRHKCPQCKTNTLNASRFIAVCQNGHMDDFPYDWWVHRGRECPSGQKEPRIRMRNISNRSDIDSLRLECTACNASRSMRVAFSSNALSGYPCTCKHPHFKDPFARASSGCEKTMQVKLRSSSGVYFPVTQSALLIPPWSKRVIQYIQKNYKALHYMDASKIPDFIRDNFGDASISDREVERSWKAVQESMKQRKNRVETSVLEDEYEVLSSDENTNPEDSFSSYTAVVPEKYQAYLEQVAVVDRLTVTQAFTGFTRIGRTGTRVVPVSQYPKKWLPAVELTGEGIFLRFRKDRLQAWQSRNAVRYDKMEKAMQKEHFVFQDFSATYVLLHSFAHLFIREIANLCGYSAASIREKIYSAVDRKTNQISMCGVLVYVSSTDSDSSLGGLISIADDAELLEKILDSMLERAAWCSADPLCISSMAQGYKNMNYAACHDCTLLPETSCERFNVFLDRASVVGLPEEPAVGYFS